MTQLTSMCEMFCQFVQKKREEKRIEEDQAAKAQNSKIPICYDDDDDYSSAITPDETVDSRSMRDEHLDTIPATESDEFIKSSVENLVPNLSSSIISYPKFDSLLEEFSGELAHIDLIPPGINEADFDHEEENRLDERLFDPFMKKIGLFLASGGSIPPGIDSDYSKSEGDNLILERLLHDDPIPLPDTLDFSNVVQVFLPFFTYPVTSSILLSFGSEDTIFDPGISNYYFSSLELDETVDSRSMRDEHLDTIPATESDEFIKSSVENLVPNLSESESGNLFEPSFYEEIIPMKIDPHLLNAESDLIESMPNHDSSIIISLMIDSLFDEFAGELLLLKPIPPGIDETDCYPEEETRFTKRWLYDNSSPRPSKEIDFDNSDAKIESFSPSPIPNKDSDSHI
nr:hypothetical protein [Tanacetum cinerariifolium]